VGKLNGAQLRVRLEKASSNFSATKVEGAGKRDCMYQLLKMIFYMYPLPIIMINKNTSNYGLS